MAKAVFLDAGHTLIYAEPSIGHIYAEVARNHGADLPPEAFDAAFHRIWLAHADELRANPGLLTHSDPEDREMWATLTRRLFDEIPGFRLDFTPWFDELYERFGRPGTWKLYPEVPETLRALKRTGAVVGIVSNWDSRAIGIFGGLGLTGQVDFTLISSLVGYRKPHPRIFEEACRRAGVAPRDAVHVGDSVHDDLEGARRAGVKGILVWRGPGEPPEGAAAIRHLGELLPHVGVNGHSPSPPGRGQG